ERPERATAHADHAKGAFCDLGMTRRQPSVHWRRRSMLDVRCWMFDVFDSAVPLSLSTFPLNHPTPAPESSNWQLTRRLLAMTWRYRWGCIKVLAAQVALLVFALSGIGFTGLGIDEIRHALDPSAPEPRWPFHLAPPANWPPM